MRSWGDDVSRPIISLNSKKEPRGKDLITLDYGQNLYNLAGTIHKNVSIWTIDESGSVGRTEKSLGRVITYNATTQLSKVDYDSLFKGIPLSVDNNGNEEIHCIDLRMNNPDKLRELVQRIGNSPFLAVTLPIEKNKVDQRKRWNNPKNELYVLSAINEIIEAIKIIDHSELVIVEFDRTNEITDKMLDIYPPDKMIVRMEDSHKSKQLQASDVIVSVTVNAINYPDDFNTELFWELYKINTNISGRGLMTTAVSDGDTDKRTKSPNYKKKSKMGRSCRKIILVFPSRGGYR